MTESKSIHELIGVSIEKLQELIKLLCLRHQGFIKTHFDENYNKIDGVIWTKKDIETYYKSILIRLRNLKERNLNLGYSKKKTILEILCVDKETLLKEMPRFRQDIQDYFYSHFDSDLNFFKPFDEWSEEDKRTYYDKLIPYLKNHLNDYHRSLSSKFGVTKEELNLVISMLPSKSREIISKHYTEDYLPLYNVIWDSKEKDYFRIYTVSRIKELIERKREVKKINLLELLGLTSYQLNMLLPLLKEKYQAFILINFDENFNLRENRTFKDNEKYILNRLIMPKLKLLISAYGFKEINKEHEELERTKRIKEAYEEIESLLYCLHTSNETFNIELLKNKNDIEANDRKTYVKRLKDFYKSYDAEKEYPILIRKKD